LELRGDVRRFLEEKRFGVLATTNEDGSPQQTVMWYEPRGDAIMMNTLRGRKKDRNLLRDPRASLCVAEDYRYVTVVGTITMDDDPAVGQADIAALARRYLGSERAAEQVQEIYAHQERVTLYLSIDRVDVHGFDDEE
jgi:PPOX class probable F420-dependent enzyme